MIISRRGPASVDRGLPTKRWLIAAATAVLAAVAGCSAPTAGSAPSAESADTADDAVGSSGGGSGACGAESGFCITVDITGAATVQGTAQALNLGTCADFAKGESPGGDLQLPGLLGEDIGGQEVSAVNEIREYAGQPDHPEGHDQRQLHLDVHRLTVDARGKSVRRTSQSSGTPRSDDRPCAVHAVSARWSQIPCQAGLAR
jgi:hypothetical protein